MTLHNIFPEVKIMDYSLYLFLALFLVTILFLYTAYRLWRNREKSVGYYLNIIESTLSIDAKQTTYKLEHYGKNIVKTPQQETQLSYLIKELEPFKYQPDAIPFDKKSQKNLKTFLQNIRQENV